MLGLGGNWVKTNDMKKNSLIKTKNKHLPKAKDFIEKLQPNISKEDLTDYQKFFQSDASKSNTDIYLGIRMGTVFKIAKEFMGMPLSEIEILLESQFHEIRVGAVSIMDFEARSKKTSEERRKQLFELYIRRHDRINNWDLVDRSAQYVVGGFIFDKSRKILFKLAKSKNTWERRTSIFSTMFFIRQNDLDDTFKIAEILIFDKQDLVQKATGWMLREAGRRDKKRLLEFLDKYYPKMPRTTLRYSIEHFCKTEKEFYMKK